MMKNLKTTVVTLLSLIIFTFPAIANENLNGLLWIQKSAEYRAICYQTFSLAKLRLLEDKISNKKSKRPGAIIVDIDETMLDNSPFTGKLIVNQKQFTYKRWRSWVSTKLAKPIPGAVEFAKFASKNGYTIFYISNRKVGEEQDTFENLKKVGFPVKLNHLLFKNKKSTKKLRRQLVTKQYRITLLIGDNLSDFHELFDKKGIDGRFAAVEKLKTEFGKKFIVLPNPIYGDWLKAIFYGKKSKKLTHKDKNRIKREIINRY